MSCDFRKQLAVFCGRKQEFCALLELARPGYVPPTARMVAEIYLDLEYEVQRGLMGTNVRQASMVTASMDCWTTDQNVAVVGMCIENELVSAVDSTGQAHAGMFNGFLPTPFIIPFFCSGVFGKHCRRTH